MVLATSQAKQEGIWRICLHEQGGVLGHDRGEGFSELKVGVEGSS